MITHISGRMIEKTPAYVIVEAAGVGYMLHISLHTYGLLSGEEQQHIYTHLHIKEDAHTLYGFAEPSEREVFRLLLSVSGIGTSTARNLLSAMSPAEMVQAISGGNAASIQAVKGIGAKTAQRVILDLKDKILSLEFSEELSKSSGNTAKEEALSALEVLGFARRSAEKVIDKVLADQPSLGVEEMIKYALKNL
ncbi:Holliday junction branch migration protein RuvA [Aureicoccus marinus]|uniref:Holliday junction branch migration complex subunit RuvA n=1 Tax=Aureicoccus marinus TaxID=754435 RepID=A0A2S7T7E7_9FLAO|nr:Holliday junction branch migration protein RuvA [Aureicoccus marinus]PQJ15840.1 Holliday junction DNA helicase RuvA [Aureicoccus marinus]